MEYSIPESNLKKTKNCLDKGVHFIIYLGGYFVNGYGHIKEDSSIALEYWRKGMGLGDPLSTYEYGFLKYADDDYQCRIWIRKHIQSVLRLAKEDDYAALHVYGTHIVADFNDEKGLDGFFDSVLESLKYFKEAAKNHYWPAAFMFYQATEEIRKSGISMPNYIDMFKDVEWYKAHQVYGMFEVLCGSDDYDECAYHFQKALWLRDDKTESAGFLAFLLNAGLVKDSIANGLSSGSIPMYYEAGLKAEDENTLCQVGLLFFAGIGKNGIREMEDDGGGKDLEKAYEYLNRSYLIFSDKEKHNQPVMIAMYG